MVKIAHASLSENGTINGKSGDQTKKEVRIQDWYNKPWTCVIRFHDPDMREKNAYAMEQAAKNDNWGYSQRDRNSGLIAARKVGYDPGKVTKPVNTDCSALQTVACIYAGIAEEALVKNGNCATTSTLKSRLKATGEVSIFSTKEYTKGTDKLLRGDILLAEGHHVATVVSANLVDYSEMSIEDVAMMVIRGELGTGSVRRAKITEMGFNYAVVQAKVNEMMKAKGKVDTPTYIWNYLYKHIGNAYGVAGIMGNMQDESGLNPKNMQNSFEKKLGYNDDTYTAAVDSGKYKNFVTDGCGMGLCQWTSAGRKAGLLANCEGRSIGNIDVQLEYLMIELNASYKSVLKGLKAATSVREASDLFLKKFERPKNQGEATQKRRAAYGEAFYNKYVV